MNGLFENKFLKIHQIAKESRDSWIKKTLEKLPKNLHILDAGAGEQQYKKFCTHLKYVSQDFCKYDGSGNGMGIQKKIWNCNNIDIISDIISIPKKNQTFDVILCTEVFEHIPDPLKAIEEFKRLLKKNGLLIITAPFRSHTHFAPYHYCLGFNKYYYEKHLVENGFSIVEITPSGNYFEYLAHETLRLKHITKKYSTKHIHCLEYIIMYLYYKLLKRISKKDINSHLILNFGFHVIAKKIEI